MKHLILIIFLCSFCAYGQINQVKTPEKELIGKITALVELDLKCEKVGDTFIFTFKDINYQQLKEYKSFQFKDIDNAFDNLFEIIMKGFKKPPKDDIIIELPEGHLKLHYVKAFGAVNMNISYSENGVSGTSSWLSKRKVKKLFGKR